MADYTDTIVNADSEMVLKDVPDESVDCMVTDPPYGMSFMGKAWDKALPSVAIWKECLRTMKPGAFAFVMCIPRQDCLARMIVNLEDAGFLVNFSPVYHTFATGFPKAANLSKLVDKRAGVEREIIQDRYKGTHKPGGSYEWTERANETGYAPITAPATPEAKALDGAYAGFQPKPAVEVVLVAMKPLTEKTYLDQALKNGKGCSWLDDGRIPYEADDRAKAIEKRDSFAPTDIGRMCYGGNSLLESKTAMRPGDGMNQQGRFAPNLLVSDDVLNDGVERKSGARGGVCTPSNPWLSKCREGETVPNTHPNPASSGSYSRYFSLDQWSEKNLPESVKRTFPFLIVPKASKSEKNAGLDDREPRKINDGRQTPIDNAFQRGETPRKNTHPTCKPIKLMSYLIAIGSRPGDVILDPFVGSGTTAVAAAILDRRYIGIELDAEMVDITERRIKWHVEQAEKEAHQLNMFATGD